MGVDHSLLRKLAEWDPAGVPITSVYLTVDGRRYPRKSDYEVRLDELLRRARAVAQALRQGCRVQTVVDRDGLAHHGGIGALLRF